MNPLIPFINQIRDPLLQNAVYALTVNPLFENLLTFPAALSWHHNYKGGLMAHTIEVCEIGLHIGSAFPQFDKDVFIAAALWHDVGKIWDYKEITTFKKPEERHVLMSGTFRPAQTDEEIASQVMTGTWGLAEPAEVVVKSSFQDRIYHISASNAEFVACARQQKVQQSVIEKVSHAILAHHGPVKEWGSPVAPQTIEALILHQADMLSAKFGATKEAPQA